MAGRVVKCFGWRPLVPPCPLLLPSPLPPPAAVGPAVAGQVRVLGVPSSGLVVGAVGPALALVVVAVGLIVVDVVGVFGLGV